MNKLTFVCPCYNHENYILDFLNSLLNQTCPNWELLIFDDCSVDKTAEFIKSISDSRIHLIQNKYNRGMAYAISCGTELAKTEIISFVASDDIICSEYVETVLSMFRQSPDIVACYTPLRYMNVHGDLLDTVTALPTTKSEPEIFAHMFINENLLPSPGMAVKKSFFKPYLPLDVGMIQYTDWQMQFFMLFQNKIKMLETPLVQYRISDTSACARNDSVIVRERIETKKLMDTVVGLIGNNKKSFMKYFGKHPVIVGQNIDSRTIPYWLGRLALTSLNPVKQYWGLQTIMNFIATDENMALLHRLYGFSFKDYMKMAAHIKINSGNTDLENKVIKYKKKNKKYRYILTIMAVLCILLIGGLVCK